MSVICEFHKSQFEMSFICLSQPRAELGFSRLSLSVKPGRFHMVVSVVSVVRKKFIAQIEFTLSRTKSCICRFFCIEHLYGRFS